MNTKNEFYKKAEHMKLALSVMAIKTDVPTAEMIVMAYEKIQEKGDQFNLADARTIQENVQNKWTKKE